MSVIHQIKLGVGSCGFINDYSILLSQHLEDLCPGMDKPVTHEERFVNNLEMDGGLEAASSSFHPGWEAPGSTLEEGHQPLPGHFPMTPELMSMDVSSNVYQ